MFLEEISYGPVVCCHELIIHFICFFVCWLRALERRVSFVEIKVVLVGDLSELLIGPWNGDALLDKDKALLNPLILHVAVLWRLDRAVYITWLLFI